MKMYKYMACLLSLLMAFAAPVLAADEFKADVQGGLATVGTSGDDSRVNEYSTIRANEGSGAYIKADVEGQKGDLAYKVEGEYTGRRDQSAEVDLDYARILKIHSDYSAFQHKLDHDKIDYMDAAVPHPSSVSPVNGGAGFGTLDPNNVPIWWDSQNDIGSNYKDPATGKPARPGATYQQIGRASIYGEDLTPDADFMITHREWESEAELTLPQLPNVTFKMGRRVETREGQEQSISMSKCTSCHVTGRSRNVDEETEDLTFGAEAKFGPLTMDYEFLTREFREKANAPTTTYDPALSPGAGYTAANGTFDNRLLYDYEDGALEYDRTPDSDKKSHLLRSRLDLPWQTALFASYVDTKIESKKESEAGVLDLSDNTLELDYKAWTGKARSKFGKKLTVTTSGKVEKFESNEVDLTFYPMGYGSASIGEAPVDPVKHRHSSDDRDVVTLGVDALYRLGWSTTLGLGAEYKDIDRVGDHFADTKKKTYKASLSSRPLSTVSSRVSYMYQDIENPFSNPDAAEYADTATGLNETLSPGGFTIGNGPLYGTGFYDKRIADLTNQPEEVHEVKMTETWTPLHNLSATLSYRFRTEDAELDRSDYGQTTHAPGVSIWYAPVENVSLSFGYNYMDQRTETAFCQGYYDG